MSIPNISIALLSNQVKAALQAAEKNNSSFVDALSTSLSKAMNLGTPFIDNCGSISDFEADSGYSGDQLEIVLSTSVSSNDSGATFFAAVSGINAGELTNDGYIAQAMSIATFSCPADNPPGSGCFLTLPSGTTASSADVLVVYLAITSDKRLCIVSEQQTIQINN